MAIGIHRYLIDVATLLDQKVLLVSVWTFACPHCRHVCLVPQSCLFCISYTISLYRQASFLSDSCLNQIFPYRFCLEVSSPDKTFCPVLSSILLTHRPETLQHLLFAGQGSATGLVSHLVKPHFFPIIKEQTPLSGQHIYFTVDFTHASFSYIIHDGRVNLPCHA